MKKYRLTDETNEMGLHRIEALIAGPWGPAGTRGGWIESEANLSQDGICWVDENAWVFGEAWVLDAARVLDVARVFGGARVFGDATVRGDARVAATTDYLCLGPLGSRQAMLTVYRTKDGLEAATGCFVGSLEELLIAARKTHAQTPQYWRDYLRAVAYAREQLGEALEKEVEK